jgi:hypothetical protein
MLRKHDARYAFKERKRLGSGASARVSLAWFLLAVRARRELTVTDSLVHLIGWTRCQYLGTRAAAKPIALAVITAGLTYLLLQPINRGVLASTVFAVFVFSSLFAGSSWFLITMDHDREIISLVFAPTPPIEGSCE